MSDEIWRPVVGYLGAYEVSNHGRVKRVGRYGTPGQILKGIIHGAGGHVRVNLSYRGVARLTYVHRIVLEAFVGPCPDGYQCRHFPDRDPRNNHLDNLSWGTAQQNALDKATHGTHPDRKGEKHPLAKLTEAAIERARKLNAQGVSQARIGAELGVHQSAISRVLRGKRWTHLKA